MGRIIVFFPVGSKATAAAVPRRKTMISMFFKKAKHGLENFYFLYLNVLMLCYANACKKLDSCSEHNVEWIYIFSFAAESWYQK